MSRELLICIGHTVDILPWRMGCPQHLLIFKSSQKIYFKRSHSSHLEYGSTGSHLLRFLITHLQSFTDVHTLHSSTKKDYLVSS